MKLDTNKFKSGGLYDTKKKVNLCVQLNLPVMFSFIHNEVHKENKLIKSCMDKLCLDFI